jgi:hypothetical protein
LLIGGGAALLLAVGILVGVLVNNKAPEQSPASPNPVQPAVTAKPKEPAKVKLTEKQKQAADEAIKALGKIEAAVEVGVTFQQYNQLAIAAKAAVNDAERSLGVCELMTGIMETMDAYKDAGNVWNRKIQYRHLNISRRYEQGDLIDRYNLPVNDKQEVDPDIALQLIWKEAAKRLTAVRGLQP